MVVDQGKRANHRPVRLHRFVQQRLTDQVANRFRAVGITALGFAWCTDIAEARQNRACLRVRWVFALLMIAVFPANVYAANKYVGGLHMPGVPVRLAMQVVYILLLLMAGWGVPGRTGESLD